METHETDPPEVSKTPPTDKPQGITCVELMIVGFALLMFTSIRFNTLVLFSPLVIIPILWIQNRYRLLSNLALWIFIIGILFLSTVWPIDIAFRPGPGFAIKRLPLLQCAGAYGHVRQRIYQGQRENVDFIAISSGCCGPKYADSAFVFFYPSRYTSRYGGNVTKEEAEKHVQETIKMLEEREHERMKTNKK